MSAISLVSDQSVYDKLAGNHLSQSKRRLLRLRDAWSSPLPGKVLVVLKPDTGLATQVFLSPVASRGNARFSTRCWRRSSPATSGSPTATSAPCVTKVMVALPPEEWRCFRTMSPKELAVGLRAMARAIDMPRYRKSKRGLKKRPNRSAYRNSGHVSTHRLL